MKPLFASKDYRAFLRNWVDAHPSSRGLLTRMANALGCQNSHLTRVLRDEVHLTQDQAFLATQFMELTELETSYFLKMVEQDRAANPVYRRRLAQEMETIKVAQENLAKRFEEDSLGNAEREMIYYSSWMWSAIHILTDIPAFQTSKAIAERLGFSEKFVRGCLQTLESFGLVRRHGDQWKISSGSIHLAKNSPMNSVQHGNWRSKAVLRSQDVTDTGIHYTMVQSLSAEDFEKIKQILFGAIDKYRSVADKSPAEELFCFTCDFFQV